MAKQGTRFGQLELFVNISLPWLLMATYGLVYSPQGLRVTSGNLGLWYLFQLRPADLRPSDKN